MKGQEIIIQPLFLLKLALLSYLSLFGLLFSNIHTRFYPTVQPIVCTWGGNRFPACNLIGQSCYSVSASSGPTPKKERDRKDGLTFLSSTPFLSLVLFFKKRDYFCLGLSPKRTKIRSLDSKLEMGLEVGKKMRGRWGRLIPHAELRLHRAVTNKREKISPFTTFQQNGYHKSLI